MFAGEIFEWSGSTATMKKYYYAGQRRVAMRVGSTLYYLLADHLGSTTVAAARCTAPGEKTPPPSSSSDWIARIGQDPLE